MVASITSGDCLNNILKRGGEVWIPFREAMERGSYTAPLFSEEFCKERSQTHNTTLEDYLDKLTPYMNFLKNIKRYDEVVMWFGDDDFCKANRAVVLKTIKDKNYKGKVILNIVDELTGKILEQRVEQ